MSHCGQIAKDTILKWVEVCACDCVFFNNREELLTHHHTLRMIPDFWISSGEWTTDNTAVWVLLNALHFYKVMTIHLFIILTSGIHSVIAGRSRESTALGKALTLHTLTRFLSFFHSHQVIAFCLFYLLCISLMGQRNWTQKMQRNWIIKLRAEGTRN